MTRFAILALSATAGFTALPTIATPSQAAIEYPWCVQYNGGDDGGGRNCGFISYEQCMMTARGAGGSCEPNLFYLDQISKAQHLPRKRQPTH